MPGCGSPPGSLSTFRTAEELSSAEGREGRFYNRLRPMRAAVFAGLVAVVAALAVGAPALLGGKSFRDDGYQMQVVPPRAAAAEAIWNGELPLWWDGAGLGVPLLSEPRHAALYPASWIGTGGLAVDLVGVLHLALLGVALSQLVAALWRRHTGRELGVKGRAAAAMVAAASGAGTASLVAGQLAQLAWLAVLLASVMSPPRHWAARISMWAGAVAAISLAGAPGVAGLAIVLAALELSPGGGAWERRLGLLALASGLGALIAAAQLVPWQMMVGSGETAGASSAGWGGWPTPAVAIAVAVPMVALAIHGRAGRWLVTALVLLGWAALASSGGAADQLAMALALAPHASAMLAAVAGIVLMMGAVRGMARWWSMAEGTGSGKRPAAALAVAAGLLVAGIATIVKTPVRSAAHASPSAWLPEAGELQLPRDLAMARAGGATLRVFCPPRVDLRRHGVRDPGAALFTIAGAEQRLSCAQSRDVARSVAEEALWRRGSSAGGRVLRRLSIPLAIVPSSTVLSAGFVELGKQDGWSLVAVPSRPLSAVYGAIYPARDRDAAMVGVLPELGGAGAGPRQLVVEGAPSSVLGTGPDPESDPDPDPESESEPDRSAATTAGRAGHDHSHDEQGHGSERVTPAARPVRGEPPPEPCQLRSMRPGSVDLVCRASAPGVAALAVAWAPGWRVTVDDNPAATLRVEGALLGVAVAAGEHRIAWRYQPPGFGIGAVLSLLGLAVLLGLSVLSLIAFARGRSAALSSPPAPP